MALHGIVCHCVDDGNINRDDILPSCQPLSDKHVNHVQDIYSLHMSQVAHQAKAYPSFWSMKQLGVFLLPPPESIPEPGYPCKTH